MLIVGTSQIQRSADMSSRLAYQKSEKCLANGMMKGWYSVFKSQLNKISLEQAELYAEEVLHMTKSFEQEEISSDFRWKPVDDGLRPDLLSPPILIISVYLADNVISKHA